MQTSNSTFSETDALMTIEETLQNVQKRINENGFVFLFWGWIVITGNLLSYFWAMLDKQPFIGFTWMILGISGGVITGIYQSRREKSNLLKTRLDETVSQVWLGVGLGAVVFYTSLIITQQWMLIGPFVLVAAGMACFVTGRIINFSALVYGAIAFWLFAIVMFWVNQEWQFLLGAMAMIPGYLVPGYMLRSRFRKQADVQKA